tara:strand:+ start:536 stop:661 length:126 start_codon:yes stop_codon:yes gene_type:complete
MKNAKNTTIKANNMMVNGTDVAAASIPDKKPPIEIKKYVVV